MYNFPPYHDSFGRNDFTQQRPIGPPFFNSAGPPPLSHPPLTSMLISGIRSSLLPTHQLQPLISAPPPPHSSAHWNRSNFPPPLSMTSNHAYQEFTSSQKRTFFNQPPPQSLFNQQFSVVPATNSTTNGLHSSNHSANHNLSKEVHLNMGTEREDYRQFANDFSVPYLPIKRTIVNDIAQAKSGLSAENELLTKSKISIPANEVVTSPIVLDDDEEEDEEDEFTIDSEEDDDDLNVLSDSEHPELGSNWRMLALFSGRVADHNLPANCSRPQSDRGRNFPSSASEPRFYSDNSGQSELIVRKGMKCHEKDENWRVVDLTSQKEKLERRTDNKKEAKLGLENSAEVNQGVVTNVMSSSRGYVLANGRTWVRKRPDGAEIMDSSTRLTSPMPSSSAVIGNGKKKFPNNSMRIINGKRIYAGSKECYQFVENGTCLAGVFCAFEHSGSTEHQAKKVCARLLRGLCRKGINCPDGEHAPLLKHQYPLCDYYLKMICVEENCPYLHVKHSEGLEPCSNFNRGLCNLGVMCNQPHRYYYSTIKGRSDLLEKTSNVRLKELHEDSGQSTSSIVFNSDNGEVSVFSSDNEAMEDEKTSTFKWYL